MLQVTNFHSSLWLSNIPLCVNTMSFSSIYLYPGVDGHSGYFYILAFIVANIVQYSCLENPMGGGAWQATVHGVAKSQIRLSNFIFTFHFHALEKEMATHSSVLA